MSPDVLQVCSYLAFELLIQTWMFRSSSSGGDVNSQHNARNQTDGKLSCFKLPQSLVKLKTAYSFNFVVFYLTYIPLSARKKPCSKKSWEIVHAAFDKL